MVGYDGDCGSPIQRAKGQLPTSSELSELSMRGKSSMDTDKSRIDSTEVKVKECEHKACIGKRWLPPTLAGLELDRMVWNYPDGSSIRSGSYVIEGIGRCILYKVGTTRIGTGFLFRSNVPHSVELKYNIEYWQNAWGDEALFQSPEDAAQWLSENQYGPFLVNGYSDES